MQHLLRRKVKLLLVVLLCCQAGRAQLRDGINLPDHDDKLYHFGINLGLNKSHYSFTHHPQFLTAANDSIAVIESINNTGINLAWLVNLNLGEHWDVRAYPLNLTFTEKAFEYTMTKFDPFLDESAVTIKKIQGITLSFPLLLKFSSDRIGNMKVFVTGGGRLDYDLAANANKKNAEELIKTKAFDYSIECGMGFHIYFPYFVMTPELRVNWGLANLHQRNPSLRFSSNVDQIYSRMISFSVTVE